MRSAPAAVKSSPCVCRREMAAADKTVHRHACGACGGDASGAVLDHQARARANAHFTRREAGTGQGSAFHARPGSRKRCLARTGSRSLRPAARTAGAPARWTMRRKRAPKGLHRFAHTAHTLEFAAKGRENLLRELAGKVIWQRAPRVRRRGGRALRPDVRGNAACLLVGQANPAAPASGG